MVTFAMGLEYLGCAYQGWQRQRKSAAHTIQGCVEKALSSIACEPIEVFCAGRTDAGVHAISQVIHFSTTALRNPQQWIQGTNYYLPKDITIHWIQPVSDSFHARHDAVFREYLYWIIEKSPQRGCFKAHAWHLPYALNVQTMQTASQLLLGEHDFNAFRSAQCQSRTSRRKILAIDLTQIQNHHFIRIKANAFLHHMVRYIVSALVQIGLQKRSISWLKQYLTGGEDLRLQQLAPPVGLYLTSVGYTQSFPLSQTGGASVIQLLTCAAFGSANDGVKQPH